MFGCVGNPISRPKGFDSVGDIDKELFLNQAKRLFKYRHSVRSCRIDHIGYALDPVGSTVVFIRKPVPSVIVIEWKILSY